VIGSIKSNFFLEMQERHPFMEPLVGLFADSGIYLLGAALVGAGNFILVPLYTRYLTPSQFGLYTLLDLAILIAVTLSTLRLEVAFLKWFGEGPRGYAVLSTTLITSGLCGAVAGGLFALFLQSNLAQAWNIAVAPSIALLLLPLILCENLQMIFLAHLRVQRRAQAFSVCAVIRLLVTILASLQFVVATHQALTGVFLGRLAGDAATLLLLIFLSRTTEWRRPSVALLRPMLSFSLPLIWSGLAVMLMDGAGRYFLLRYGSMEEVGIYGAAAKISSLFPLLVTQPFGVAWGGMLFRIVKMKGARETYSRIFSYVLLGSQVAALLLSMCASRFVAVLGNKTYEAAISVLPLVFLTRAVAILEYPASTGIYLSGRTGWFAAIYSAGLITTLALCSGLVPLYGMYGAAFGWLAGWLVTASLMLAIGQRYYALRLEWKFLALPVLWWTLFLAGQYAYSGALLQFSWVAKFTLALVVVLGGASLCVRDFRNAIAEEAAK